MEASEFYISIHWDDGHPTLCAKGRLDIATAPHVSETIAGMVASGTRRISLDLGQVSFLDSEGVKVLLKIYQFIRISGGTIRMVSCSQPVRRILDLLSLGAILECPAATVGSESAED